MPLPAANPKILQATRLQALFVQGPVQLANLLRQQSQLANAVGRQDLDDLLGAEFVTAAATAHAAAKAFILSSNTLPANTPEIPDFPASVPQT